MPGGHRRYDEETVRFLCAVKEAQAAGFTLAEIEDYLTVVRRGRMPASQALRVRAAAKIGQIDARIARLRRMRDELARIAGCACESLDHCTCGAAWLARQGRDSPARPWLLHVTNGESAANTLRQTSLGGAVLPWQDALHEGPVPAGPRHLLLATRAAFLSGCGWGSKRAIRSALERRDRTLADAWRDGWQVVVWFEHDLYDQLQLLDVLALASAVAAAPELIVVGSFPGRPSFRGLGELTADQLESLWPSRTTATPRAGCGRVGLGCARPVRAIRAGDAGHCWYPGAAVRGPGATAATGRTACSQGRLVGDRAADAAGYRGRRDHPRHRVPCRARPRGGAVPRRCLVLPRPRRAGPRSIRTDTRPYLAKSPMDNMAPPSRRLTQGQRQAMRGEKRSTATAATAVAPRCCHRGR
jgi:hypothetical protein